MSGALVEAVKALPLQDRLHLIEEIWSTIEPDDLPLPSADEIQLAEDRLHEYRTNPGDVISLEELKARFSSND